MPSYIQASGDAWEIITDEFQALCWKCADPSHRAGNCPAQRRKEHVVMAWEEEMGEAVEVLFLSRRSSDMDEASFQTY